MTLEAEAEAEVAWRQLRPGAWAARRGGRHLGTVERGRRWIATDADCELIGAFRSFADAQAAVLDPAAHRRPSQRARARGRVGALRSLLRTRGRVEVPELLR